MRSRVLSIAALLFAVSLIATNPVRVRGQEGQPLELPCVTGVTVSPIGQAMPPDVSGQALVALRVTIAPGGGFQAHTHPGTLVVAIESGAFEYTMLDDTEQNVMRAPANGTPAASAEVTKDVPITLNPGDWFVEPMGMIHSATNPGNEPTVVLVTGLVDPNLPFVQCVESGTPMP